ncbi:S1C family serine protease [Limnoglobus roseus]|uniref:PDZ domain-containing protein n=1 Tax=Limnoglobus roseus TaxID=2598579 RepID=A0A5C1AFA2_9BACT|nr:trypsin-like peptidase domain-containing protein [Limnoglobus roseus]QEL16877.1 PDZ domain-containing protein [Limnoglobus roseus]
MRQTSTILGVAILGAFLGSVTTGLFVRPTLPAMAQSPLPAPPQSYGAAGEPFDVLAARLAPSIVAVDAVKPQQPSTTNKGKPLEESGSGVLLTFEKQPNVFAVTNNHVVSGAKAEEITVTLNDGRILRPARVWADPESDIALLMLDAPNLKPAAMGDSDRLRPGQWVLAFGSPFGLNQTVTHGIISAKDRGQISLGNTIRIKEFLQTDAAINPGSSGGPLVSTDGTVIGINTAIASNSGSNSGVAFSIPINLVKRIGRELLETGGVNRGYLGVQLSPTLEPSEALRLGLDKVRGALVDSVNAGSPAALAGLKVKDVILKLEGVELRDENHLINLISNLPPNHKVRLSVWREKQLRTVEVTIGEWSTSAKR